MLGLRRWEVVTAAAVVTACSVAALASHGTPSDPLGASNPVSLVQIALLLAFGLAALQVARKRAGPERRAWAWFAAVGLSIVPLTVVLAAVGLAVGFSSDAFAAASTVPTLAVYALAFVGLLVLGRHHAGPRQTTRLVLDAFVMAGCLFFIVWSAAYRDIYDASLLPRAWRILIVAFPVLDAALLTVAVMGLALPDPRRPPAYRLLLVGFALQAVADWVTTYLTLDNQSAGLPVSLALGTAAMTILVLAALATMRSPAWTTAPARRAVWVELLPVWPVALALGAALETVREHGTLTTLQLLVAIPVVAAVVVRMAFTVRDNHRLAAEAAASAAFKTDLLRFVSHEMANPLSPLKLQLSLRRRARPDDDWTIIDRSVARLDHLAADVRLLALAETGRLVGTPQRLRLDEQARLAVAAALPNASARGLRIDVEAAPVEVVAEPERLGQLLDNLLSNAVKYTPDGGHVTVRVAATTGEARVEVTDTGMGLTPEQAARLFAPFSRVHVGGPPGTGLGLYICKGIAEAHGGRVGVTSPGPGKGSTFWFTIPATATPAPAEPAVPVAVPVAG